MPAVSGNKVAFRDGVPVASLQGGDVVLHADLPEDERDEAHRAARGAAGYGGAGGGGAIAATVRELAQVRRFHFCKNAYNP